MSGPEIRPQLGQVQGCLNGQHLELCFLTDLLALQPTAASPIPLVPGGGSPVVLTAAAAFSPGQVGYISAALTANLAISNGTLAQAFGLVMCVEPAGIPAGGTGRFIFGGRVSGLTGGTAGSQGYLSTTPGTLSTSPDLTTGHYFSWLGQWLGPNDFLFATGVPRLN